MPELSRRSLITGLISLMAAPAIVRASSLMPVRATIETPVNYYVGRGRLMVCTVAGVSSPEEWVDIGVLRSLGVPRTASWTPGAAWNLGDIVVDEWPISRLVDGEISRVTFAPEPGPLLPDYRHLEDFRDED